MLYFASVICSGCSEQCRILLRGTLKPVGPNAVDGFYSPCELRGNCTTGTDLECDSRVILSPIATFVIGEECNEVLVHSNVVASLSPTLGTLLNGSLKESVTKHVTMPNVDSEVFNLVYEYAYTSKSRKTRGIMIHCRASARMDLQHRFQQKHLDLQRSSEASGKRRSTRLIMASVPFAFANTTLVIGYKMFKQKMRILRYC